MQVFAAPLDFRKEHRGKNNVVATYLTSGISGLAPGTICGRALVSSADEQQDVTYQEVRLSPHAPRMRMWASLVDYCSSFHLSRAIAAVAWRGFGW